MPRSDWYSGVATNLLKLGSRMMVLETAAAIFNNANVEILIHRLNDDYFLAAVLDERAIAGQIRFSLRMVVQGLLGAGFNKVGGSPWRCISR